MRLPLDEPRPQRPFLAVLFVLSAAAAAALLRLAWVHPLGVGLAVALALVAARWWARRRVRRLMRSGDIDSILSRWSSAIAHAPHAATMGPLLTATALGAYGWVERAREMLQLARRGPAWEAALEHRLFLDALLLAFEGEAEKALDTARKLQRLPLPASVPRLARRVQMLRAAVGALARAFAHQGRRGDRELLIAASDSSPLVYWAMRYAAAIVDLDSGHPHEARLLVAGAPAWPDESYFHSFHRQIAQEAARRMGGRSPADVEPPDPAPPGGVVRKDE
ncbi:MAG: hypothetical protein HY744_31035 [Deltaproteobacteria bacterium]|nr:hypothetical protein [Deltaproteobacteria bacterium]